MEVVKLLYIVVEDDFGGHGNEELRFRYTRHVLHSTLQLMGCKARHTFKISQRVFEIMRTECLGDTLAAMGVIKEGRSSNNMSKNDDKIRSIPFESYKKRTTVVVKRRRFIDAVCDVLAEYKYAGPNQRADLVLACRIRSLPVDYRFMGSPAEKSTNGMISVGIPEKSSGNMDRVVDDDSPYGQSSNFLMNDRPSVDDEDVNPSVSPQGSVLGSWGNKKWGDCFLCC